MVSYQSLIHLQWPQKELLGYNQACLLQMSLCAEQYQPPIMFLSRRHGTDDSSCPWQRIVWPGTRVVILTFGNDSNACTGMLLQGPRIFNKGIFDIQYRSASKS